MSTEKTPICAECGRPHYKARERMPLNHAIETVEGILISRLDDLYYRWIQGDGGRFGLGNSELLQLLQDLQITLFPNAFDDGESYETDPNERQDVPRRTGLFRRQSPEVIFAKHVIDEERRRNAGKLKDADGREVFSNSDLLVLRGRRESRECRHAATA